MAGVFEVGSIVARLRVDAKGFKKGLTDARKTVVDWGKRVKRAINPLTSVFKGIRKQIFSLRGVLVGLGAGFGAVNLIQRAQDVESLSSAFRSLSASVGAVSGSFLKDLRVATRGAVSNIELMRVTNAANLLGVVKSQAEFTKLAEIARRLGSAVGRGPVEALNNLSLGIGRQSRLILDNLGIIVRIEDANNKYAATLGVTVDALTDSEKRQAFYNATIEAAQKKVALLGEDTVSLSDEVGRFTATLSNTTTLVAKAFVSGGPFGKMADFLEENRFRIAAFAQAFAEGFGAIIKSIGRLVDEAFSGSGSKKFFSVLSQFIASAIKLASDLILAGIKAIFSELGLTIITLLTLLGAQIIAGLTGEISKILAELGTQISVGFKELAAKIPGLSSILGLESPEKLEKSLELSRLKLKFTLKAIDEEIGSFKGRVDDAIDATAGRLDRAVLTTATEALKNIRSFGKNTVGEMTFVDKEIASIIESLEKVAARLSLREVDIFQSVEPLKLQKEIQSLGDQFNRLVQIRSQLVRDFPEIVKKEDVVSSGQVLESLQKIIEATNKAFVDFVKGPRAAKEELGKAFADSVRRAELALSNATSTFVDFGNENLDVALQSKKATQAIDKLESALLGLVRSSGLGFLGLEGLASSFERALRPIFISAEEFDNLLKKFTERERALKIEVSTLGLSEAEKEIVQLDLVIQKFQTRFDPKQKARVDELRESLFKLGQLKDAAAQLEEFSDQIDNMSESVEQAQLSLLAIREGDIVATFFEIETAVRRFTEAVQASSLSLAEQNDLIEKFEQRAKKLKELENEREIRKTVGETVNRVLVDNVGRALVTAFRKGESISKQWSNVAAQFFEDAMNKAIKSLSASLTGALSKLFESAAGAGAAGSIATGLLGIGGLIFNSIKSKSSSTIEDFSSAINSSEAVRGVVAGPTNVAISKIGESLKQAMRTTEILLERIAISVEGGGFGGGGGSGSGGGDFSAILPLTTSSAT